MNTNTTRRQGLMMAILALTLVLAAGLACGEGTTATPEGPTPTAITGVTYDDLARYPDNYLGSHLLLSGKVVQIIRQNSSSVEIRANITRTDYSWEDDVYLYYRGSLPERILEDDIMKFYVLGRGLKEYKTVLGARRTIPKLEIIRITDLNTLDD